MAEAVMVEEAREPAAQEAAAMVMVLRVASWEAVVAYVVLTLAE